MIKIYNFPAPTRAVRPIWLCEEMEIPYQVEMVTFPTGADYRERYVIGSVPFLEDDGVAIGESIAMLFYIAEKYGPTPLLPERNDPSRARVLSLSVFSEATFGGWLNALLGTKFMAPDDQKNTWQVELAQARCQNSVDHALKMLGDGQFLAANRFTIADIAVGGCFGMWCDALGNALPEKLANYRARLESRPAFQRALKRARGEPA